MRVAAGLGRESTFHSLGITLELLRNALALPGRLRHRWKNRRRLSASASLQRTLKINGDKAAVAGLASYRGIYNVALYVSIAEQDLSTYAESLVFARSEWHRKFYARGLAVLLFEVAEDLPELLGKQYREWLMDIQASADYLQRLNVIGKSINAFRKAHEPFLGRVRNYVGAHRDHDAFAQYEVLHNLDVLEVFQLAPRLSEPIRALVAFHTDLLRHMSDPSIVLRQLAKARP